jgi:nucleotide-binding universal stress UspA family protein
MASSQRLLIAVDESEASHRAVAYVGAMLVERSGSYVCLLHGLPQLPPNLLESAGSEDPDLEKELEAEMRNKQAAWLKRAQQAAQPMLNKAKTILCDAHVPADLITTRFALSNNVDALVTEILEAAQSENCDTIVVGRETFRGLDKIFKHHVADDLIRRGHGYTIWVVE